MLSSYFASLPFIGGLRSSPAGPYLDGFAASLLARGYPHVTGPKYIRAAVHLARWIRVPLAEIDGVTIARFDRHLSKCRCQARPPGQHRALRVGARLFLAYLREIGIGRRPIPEHLATPTVIDRFRSWMQLHRGATDATLRGYTHLLTKFVDAQGMDPERYDVRGVREYVLKLAKQHGRYHVQHVATALRMFLRFLVVEGQCSADLVAAVPKFAHWRLSTLPRYMTEDNVERVIAANNPRTPMGRRDRAILLLLARLGLRAGDVVGLRLDDVDWRRSRIRMRGKGRRETWLPLPQDVGDSILAYLSKGRPESRDEHVFLRVQAPTIGLNSTAIPQLVRRAIVRAGIDSPSYGAHVLRHSAATTLLRHGASLDAIGALLRQRSQDTSALYAKVDVLMLGQIAQPWPQQEMHDADPFR